VGQSPKSVTPIAFQQLQKSCSYALLAHSVEHFHGKEEVVGSIPTEGSAI